MGGREPGGLLRHGFRLPECPRPPGRNRERFCHLSTEGLGIQRFVEFDDCKFGSQLDIFSTVFELLTGTYCQQREVEAITEDLDGNRGRF